ncbi:uncharacterized protein TNCV_428871 [Trichonephila clavipes]|nr:uncharacterized protein TNCV_428871 [Trichonephila clavipes]
MFNNCQGSWSVHRLDSTVWGVINFLDRKELLISEKESLPAQTCTPSQRFSASSEPYKFVFFSEKLDFSQPYDIWHRTATAGSDVVQSGRPIFDDFFQHLWPYIGNNTTNVVFQMVQRLWLIRIDQ